MERRRFECKPMLPTREKAQEAERTEDRIEKTQRFFGEGDSDSSSPEDKKKKKRRKFT